MSRVRDAGLQGEGNMGSLTHHQVNAATIAAIATPPGSGGVGIIRLSGALSLSIAQSIIGAQKQLQPRYAHFSHFFDPQGTLIDQGIVIYFPAPNSFTGEDIVEFHAHGGMVVLHHLLEVILNHGAQHAEPGEFSLRAFLNNKIDLAQAEAIADLIHANSRQAAQSAMRSLQGDFSKKIHAVVEQLIRIRVQVEAQIDFPEEEIDPATHAYLCAQMRATITHLDNIEKVATQGKLLCEGIQVVISGKPNVGKSTLLNQLCGDDIAIVSDHAGTTRDVIRERLNFEGIPLTLVDTAGIHETNNPVEQEGIRRAQKEIQRADLILLIHDSRDSQQDSNDYFYAAIKDIDVNKKIIIHNKVDLLIDRDKQNYFASNDVFNEHVFISAKTGEGIQRLKNIIKKKIGAENFEEGVISARQRHIHALINAKNFIVTALENLNNGSFYEFIAEELRLATMELNKITGEFSSDDLLGEIFSTFCIGK